MKYHSLFLSALVLVAVRSSAQDLTPKDERFEERLNRIYQKYNQSEISDAEWNKIAGQKVSEQYSLQAGDNLWDVSSKFFGDGFYWPKVWQLNDKITNPHLIRVGNTLKFSSGTDVAPPSLDVQEQASAEPEKVDDPEKVVEPEKEEVQVVAEEDPTKIEKSEIVIPKGKQAKPILSKIPDSFPEWRYSDTSEFDKDGLSVDRREKSRVASLKSPSFISSVIDDKVWATNGKIFEMEGNQTVASTYQKVIVQLDGPVTAGDTYTVFDDHRVVSDHDSGKEIGNEVRIKGTIIIGQRTEGARDTYSAIVKRTLLPIITGDKITQGDHLLRVEMDQAGAESNVSAKIVDGEGFGSEALGSDTRRLRFNINEVVYLNRGAGDGLQPGNILNVLKNYKSRNPDAMTRYDGQSIGKIKVVHTGDKVATAIVITTNDVIFPGDETAMGPSVEQESDAPAPETPEATEDFGS